MTNPQAVLRSLIVYALCVPVAVVLGYLITSPLDFTTFMGVGMVLFIIGTPILLRFHKAIMVAAWNASAVVFFLPGHPQLWIVAIFLSFMVCIGHLTLEKRFRFIAAPSLKWPLILMILVVLATAKATGGIGIRSLGGEVYGGRRYVELLCAILGYFALTAQPIPPERARLYVGLFFLGALTAFIPDFFPICPPLLKGIFLIFPPYDLATGGLEVGTTRLIGLATACVGAFTYMLARYGIQGIFTLGKPWRALCFVAFCVLSLLGGFRSTLIACVLLFSVQFFVEGMHRTKLLPVFALALVILGTLTIAFLPRLPFTFQRALAFLPLEVDPVARQNAEASTQWRLQMWKALLPQVPHYLLVGKGYALSHEDYELGQERLNAADFEGQWGATLAGDYHNGPLSVVIPFGLWGAIAFLWFMGAALRVLWRNHRYGDPALHSVNALLLAAFITRTLMFILVVGGFHTDMLSFAGLLGLSVSLNNGVASPAPEPLPEEERAPGFVSIIPRPRPPAFGR